MWGSLRDPKLMQTVLDAFAGVIAGQKSTGVEEPCSESSPKSGRAKARISEHSSLFHVSDPAVENISLSTPQYTSASQPTVGRLPVKRTSSAITVTAEAGEAPKSTLTRFPAPGSFGPVWTSSWLPGGPERSGGAWSSRRTVSDAPYRIWRSFSMNCTGTGSL
jgi:hypothetical protein